MPQIYTQPRPSTWVDNAPGRTGRMAVIGRIGVVSQARAQCPTAPPKHYVPSLSAQRRRVEIIGLPSARAILFVIKQEGNMKGWIMLVTGPDAEIHQNLRRRIVAAAVNDFDEAFAVARDTVPGVYQHLSAR